MAGFTGRESAHPARLTGGHGGPARTLSFDLDRRTSACCFHADSHFSLVIVLSRDGQSRGPSGRACFRNWKTSSIIEVAPGDTGKVAQQAGGPARIVRVLNDIWVRDDSAPSHWLLLLTYRDIYNGDVLHTKPHRLAKNTA